MTKRQPPKEYQWKKGQSGNPNGGPPAIDSALRQEINRNKNAVRKLILLYLNMTERQCAERQGSQEIPMVEKLLGACIEKINLEGDILKLKMLLELAIGKLPEDPQPFELTTDEQAMVLKYRQLIANESKTDN